jgi:hypothetical protein
MIDLDFYAWRKPVTIDGQERLIVPMSDPVEYEWDFGLIFGTPDEAQDTLEAYEYEDIAREEGWVLVHYSGVRVDITPDV